MNKLNNLHQLLRTKPNLSQTIGLKFSKMQGLGNSYIYLNCLSAKHFFSEEVENKSALFSKIFHKTSLADEHSNDFLSGLAQQISNPNFGIGSDGLVLILPSKTEDYRMQMFNADGSEAEMCGNAVRCVAKYLYDHKLTENKAIRLETKSGTKILNLHINAFNKVEKVEVNMGLPILEQSLIPAELPNTDPNQEIIGHAQEFFGEKYKINLVSMGNPHLVIFVDKISDHHILELGPKLEVLDYFPNRINVEFVEVISPQKLKMRVWERGTGETLACGTGACAVAVAGLKNNLIDSKVSIELLGGTLDIEILKNGQVLKTGPAEFICEGDFYI